MRTPTVPNSSLIPAVVAALLQAGGQLFAITLIVGTVTKAPPRSLALYAGEYGYDRRESGPSHHYGKERERNTAEQQ